MDLAKLAIDYSDGVIAASPDCKEDLLDYARGKNIPVLGHDSQLKTNGLTVDECHDFYMGL